jgi:hypothetical protein
VCVDLCTERQYSCTDRVLCVCACNDICVRVSLCVHVCVRVFMCVCVYVHLCVHTLPVDKLKLSVNAVVVVVIHKVSSVDGLLVLTIVVNTRVRGLSGSQQKLKNRW